MPSPVSPKSFVLCHDDAVTETEISPGSRKACIWLAVLAGVISLVQFCFLAGVLLGLIGPGELGVRQLAIPMLINIVLVAAAVVAARACRDEDLRRARMAFVVVAVAGFYYLLPTLLALPALWLLRRRRPAQD